MKPRHALVPTLLILGSLAGAVLAAGQLDDAEAVFEDARAKDELIGVLNSTAKELHVTFTVPAGSAFTFNAAPNTTLSDGATGLGFRLCDPEGADLDVAGSQYDKSKPENDKIKWKSVPLETFGVYTLIAGAGTPGGMSMKLSVADATTKVDETSTEDLAINDAATVEFEGRDGDKLKFDLKANGKGSKFKGEAFQILRPDGSLMPDVPAKTKGNMLLDADGTYQFKFTNAGKAAGGWRAKLTVKPRGAKKRKGLVSVPQTGLVPSVKSVDPPEGFNRDTALRVTLTGKGFQPGLDVRLVRKNRMDLLGTDIELVSSEEVNFLVDLDTTETQNQDSIGNWTVSVWNEPIYTEPGNRDSLDRTSPLVDESKRLKSVSSGSISLPDGVEEGAEVWKLVFNDAFQDDLNHMNLGSEYPELRDAVNTIVQNYVVAYVRDLMEANETTGSIKSPAVPLCVVLDDVPLVAGQPGVDFNRIEIGGEYEDGDPRALADPLEWGYSDRDALNSQRDDLMLHDADGNRLGLGVRTAVLDTRNGNNQASASWRQAMEPLRVRPLTELDVRYFTGQFNSNNPGQIDRYADIVEQIERAAREIAAITAHHMGRAMGLATAGDGPMASPSFSGEMWRTRATLDYSSSDLALLRNVAVPNTLPGKSSRLKLSFFPLIDRQPELLSPNAVTGTLYSVKWEFVGGRCNALPADYNLGYARGSEVPLGLVLTFEGLEGVPPICFGGQCSSVASVYCGVLEFAIIVDDIPRNTGSYLFHRLKMIPNVSQLPTQLQAQAAQCRDAVIQAP